MNVLVRYGELLDCYLHLASRGKYKCRHRPKKRGILFYTETTIEEVHDPNLLQPYNNLWTKFIPDDELQNKSN